MRTQQTRNECLSLGSASILLLYLLYWYKESECLSLGAASILLLYLLYWYKESECLSLGAASTAFVRYTGAARYSLYLLYWYKSTHPQHPRGTQAPQGTHFTCFTGTKVGIHSVRSTGINEKATSYAPHPAFRPYVC
jgi:hypothetical protein